MKTEFLKTSRRPGWFIASMGIALVSIPTMVSGVTISLDPATQNVGVGDSFILSLRIAGLGNHTAPSLGAFDLDINFDSQLVQFDSITFGDPLLGDLLGPSTSSINGSDLNPFGNSLNLFSISVDDTAALDAAQPDQFTLANLRFTALGQGSSLFSPANVILGDGNGDPLSNPVILDAKVDISIQSVPEGGAGWAAALAFGAMVLAHRRLRQSH